MKAQMHNFSTWINETDPVILKKLFLDKLLKSGFGVLKIIEKHFTPQGYTALFLLSESHFAIHTFPEENQTYLEITSCIKIPFDNFINSL